MAGGIDRRVIFLFMGAAVALPLLFPLHLPVEVSQPARDVYRAIEEIPEGSLVLMDFTYGPSTYPEVNPMAVAFLRHCLRRHLRLICMSLWTDGAFLASAALDQVAEREFHARYGEDYVNLGFKAGNEVVIKSIAESFSVTYPVDNYGRPTATLPIMRGVENLANVDFIISLTAGYPGTNEWVLYAADPLGKPIISGTTAVQVNEMMPYVRSGQVLGLLGGMSGAAEYEALVGRPDRATRFMDAQSVAHLVIVVFIVLGNIAYAAERRRARRRG